MAANLIDEKQIFNDARQISDAEKRLAFVHSACGEDSLAVERILKLLRVYEEEQSFLEVPPAAICPTRDEPIGERTGTQIGPYKLLQQIGEGGMGVVYMAEQTEPVQRRVALKIIRPGMDSRQVIARFEAERQALAMMDHPNIAKVLDAGTTASGRPYFVMELVKGQPITQYCDEHHLTPRQRLELLLPVCQAIQHAHQKGIIHRDIKPTNILVAEYDQQPVPKVIDFGVAKATGQTLTEKTMFTGLGQIVGTLEYMSPEQAKVNQLDIDTRSDIYSLGVLLYELLTGSTPFDRNRLCSAAFDEMLRIIREEEPPKPSTRLSDSKDSLPSIAAQRHTEPAKLTKLVRGELDWIVMKALDKDRNRRYETANGLARDIERYLHDEPVQAGPPSAWYRFRKFACRNRRTLATASLLGFMLLVTLGVSAWQLQERTARRAEEARQTSLTELAVEQALDQAAKLRAALDAERRVKGTRELLNQPARWHAQIKMAQSELARARNLAARAGEKLRPDLDARIQRFEQELGREEADYHLAMRLETIRLDRAVSVHGKFDYSVAHRRYSIAFQEAGLIISAGGEEAAAAAIRNSAIKDQLLAALDDWLLIALSSEQPELTRQLLKIARLTDPHPWRDQVREEKTWEEFRAIEKAADEAQAQPHQLAALSPQMFHLVSRRLPRGKREAWLRKAQAMHPADFWIAQGLAECLIEKKEYRQAEAYYRMCLAIRPGSAAVYLQLGFVLDAQKDLDGAAAAFNKSLEIAPDYALAWYNLGVVRYSQGNLSGAIDAYKKSTIKDPQYVQAWENLCNALDRRNDKPGAFEAFKKARAIDAKRAWGPIPSHYQDLVALEERLPAVLKGNNASPADYVAFADLCQNYLKRYRDAVLLYANAFAREPKLADNLWQGYRFKAACAAALAADANDPPVDRPSEKDKTQLRQQALDWLRADLGAWEKHRQQDWAHPLIMAALEHWQGDDSLASVRGAILPKLPAAERQKWQQFWDDVEQNCARLQGTGPGPTLRNPVPGATLENGSVADKRRWTFTWSEIPGATSYHLYVIGPQAAGPMINEPDLKGLEYQQSSSGSYIVHTEGWKWRVRAFANGHWTRWSEERTFNVASLTLEEIVSFDLKSDSPEVLYRRGLATQKVGNASLAVTYLLQAVKLKLDHSQAHAALADALTSHGRLEEVKKIVKELIGASSEQCLAYYWATWHLVNFAHQSDRDPKHTAEEAAALVQACEVRAREVLAAAARLKDARGVNGALEAESLAVAQTDCLVRLQWMRQWDDKNWSNAWQQFCQSNKGNYVEFELPASPGPVSLAVQFTKAPDYAIVEVAVDGKAIGKPFDGYDPSVVNSGLVEFGPLDTKEGPRKIRFTAIDKNPKSSHYRMGIDCLILKPVK